MDLAHVCHPERVAVYAGIFMKVDGIGTWCLRKTHEIVRLRVKFQRL
jgi:hypothetical protein